MDIKKKLFTLKDTDFKKFNQKLIPTVDPKNVIGIRTPALRTLAKEIYKDGVYDNFINELPHIYFEENQLHAFIISQEKNYDKCIELIEIFLPYVDNWATCDQMTPKIFKKHHDMLHVKCMEWIGSDKTYTIRFGIKMFMDHFLDDDFDKKFMEEISIIRSKEYYVNMMIAWYFATALAKQYDATIDFIKEEKLDPWTHNKTIQKAIESYRITDEQKEYLRSLKIKRQG